MMTQGAIEALLHWAASTSEQDHENFAAILAEKQNEEINEVKILELIDEYKAMK